MDFLNNLSPNAAFLAFIYFIIVFLGILIVFQRFGFNKLTLFIVLIFWEGLFNYISRSLNLSFEWYRVLVVAYSLFLFFPKVFEKKTQYDFWINLSFFLFSVSFFISNLNHLNSLSTVLSQYGFKYGLPFLLYHGFKDVIFLPEKMKYLIRLMINVLLMQIVFSVFKVILIGFIEAIVGSLSAKGAGVAVAFPILGFILYWLANKGKLSQKKWLIGISFVFVAIASVKRAPVFIFPVILIVLASFMSQKIRTDRLLKFIPVFVLLFFLGVKTNPTLNPDRSMWGEFNLNYALEYALRYNFGDADVSLEEDETSGRGGSLFILFSPQKLDLNEGFSFIFGHGIVDVALKSKGRFLGGGSYEIEHEGSMGRVHLLIYAIGYFGVTLYLLFAYSIIRVINNRKFRILILIFFLWEIFLYGGVILTTSSMALIFIFICLFSNIIFSEKGFYLKPQLQKA